MELVDNYLLDDNKGNGENIHLLLEGYYEIISI